MPKSRVTRRQLLVAAAPAVAALPLAKVALADPSQAGSRGTHAGMDMHSMGHAAMSGDEVPAPGGPHDLDSLLYPPKPLPHEPGRVREYALTAIDREIEVI